VPTDPAAAARSGRRWVALPLLVVLSLAVVASGLGGLAWWALRAVTVEQAVATVGASSDPDPTGSGYAFWAHNDDGAPVRWDPCAPIELVVGSGAVPAGGLDDLQVAVERLGRESGLRFVVLGETDERPSAERSPYQPDRYGERWAPVLVAWARPGEAGLRTTDRGLAIPVAVGPEGDRTYVSGQVVLNAERGDLRPGFADRSHSWGATLLHELGHLVGLAHAEDESELMAVHPGEGPVELGPGDRTGLRELGSEAGCREGPPAGHVRVVTAEGR
jgi:hypothetical protein